MEEGGNVGKRGTRQPVKMGTDGCVTADFVMTGGSHVDKARWARRFLWSPLPHAEARVAIKDALLGPKDALLGPRRYHPIGPTKNKSGKSGRFLEPEK